MTGLSNRAKMVGGGRPILPEILAKNAEFQSIFARSTSAVTPSEKVQITRIGSQLIAVILRYFTEFDRL